MRIARDALAGVLAPIIAVILFSGQALPLQIPSFEVASIKQNNDRELQPALRYTPSGVDFARVPITWIIGEAYQLPYYSPTAISASDNAARELLSPTYRYDISARAESAASRNAIRLMLQSLLAERFKLTLHHESKDESVYKLLVGKGGPRLRDSADQSEVGQPVIAGSPAGYDFRHMEMARLAGFLSSIMDRPVVDSTGLKGFYDFSLNRGEAPQDKSRDTVSSSILAAIESQLGLKLEPARAPVDHVVIDHLEKPSENWMYCDLYAWGFSAAALAQRGGTPPSGVNVETNGPNLFAALEEQLGLKPQPKNLPVLMIDQIKFNRLLSPGGRLLGS